MANEKKKDFNAMLQNSKDMPKIVDIKDEAGQKKWGGKTLLIAPPLYYDDVIKQIPKGYVVTLNDIRAFLAKENNAEVTCPLTAGIFTNIVAWASYQRTSDITPYWRVIKKDGELNIKYPEACDLQKQKLEEEGFEIITKGKNNKYYVKDFTNKLFDLNKINNQVQI